MNAHATPQEGSLNVVILTQDDPFFLAENLDYLFSKIPGEVKITGCVVLSMSPFGKKGGLLSQAYKTWQVFGTQFFVSYGARFVANKFKKRKKISNVLRKYSIPLIPIDTDINSPSAIEKIKGCRPDLLISIAGNQIFKEQLIALPSKGCLNLHTALLPKYRGLMPSFWVLKNDEEETGVSVFFVNNSIDSGPILVQKKIPIQNESQRELIKKSKKIGMEAIAEAIHKIRKGEYELLPNKDTESTYFSFPTREDVRVFKRRGKRFY